MDPEKARAALLARRADVEALLDRQDANDAEDDTAESVTGDIDDRAEPLTSEGVDNAITEQLEDRLGAIARALQRLDDGTYGRSVRSGDVIPDARLEADPAAELTVEEAAADEREA